MPSVFDQSGLAAAYTDAVSPPSSLHDALLPSAEPSTTLFVDMMADLQQITSEIESVKKQVSVRRQRRATSVGAGRASPSLSSPATAAAASTRPRRKAVERKVAAESSTAKPRRAAAASSKSASPTSSSLRRKKDEDALDCIYAELQESVGMCRYWGKKCWNLRVPKAKGGFHSLCHFHRAKANDNQRRFDFKRRGTLWRSFKPDPNYVDISLYPGTEPSSSSSAAATESQDNDAEVSFEPFERPEPLRDQDVALLRELIGSATI